jgi:tetratricopeptide (TPR) repeat protein
MVERLTFDWRALSPDDFEELCYDLLGLWGFTNRDWFHGPGDRGRDIRAEKIEVYLPGQTWVQKWVVQCKRYTARALAVDDLAGTKAWADANPELDFLCIMTPDHLSPSAKDWVDRINQAGNVRYRIQYYERPQFEEAVMARPQLLRKYFPDLDPIMAEVTRKAELQRHIETGQQRIRARDYDEAIEILNRALELGQVVPSVHILLAVALAYKGDLRSSYEHSLKAIQLDPFSYEARFHAGQALSIAQQYEAALDLLEDCETLCWGRNAGPAWIAQVSLLIGRCLYAMAKMRFGSIAMLADRHPGHVPEQLQQMAREEYARASDSWAGYTLEEDEETLADLAWREAAGRWTTEPPIRYEDLPLLIRDEPLLVGGDHLFADFTFSCRFKIITRAAGFLVRCDRSGRNGYMIQIFPNMLRRHVRYLSNYFWITQPEDIAHSLDLQIDTWHALRFEVRGQSIETYVDDTLIDTWENEMFRVGRIGFRLFIPEMALYDQPTLTVHRRFTQQ